MLGQYYISHRFTLLALDLICVSNCQKKYEYVSTLKVPFHVLDSTYLLTYLLTYSMEQSPS